MLFYTILIIALIWIIINNTYLPWITKNKPILGVCFYRNIFVSILLLPVLFFADFSKVTINFILVSIVLWIIGAAWLIFQLKANKYLSMGVVSSLVQLNNIWVIIFSVIVLWEKLSLIAYIWATILIISLIILWYSKSDRNIKDMDYKRWIFFVVLRIFTLIIWVSSFIYFSREVDPYFSIYISEFTVLLWYALFLTCYNAREKQKNLQVFKNKEFIRFFLMCIFPAFSSFAFFYASTIWNPSIVALIFSSSLVFITLVWYFFYKQKLKIIQWLMIIFAMIGLFLINL